MTELYEIEAERVDTGEADVAELIWWDENDVQFVSDEVPWCLFVAIVTSLDGSEFEFDEGVLREAFRQAVEGRVHHALSNHGCSQDPDEKYTEEANWDVEVNESRVNGDYWDTGTSALFAHPMFTDPGGRARSVAVARNPGTNQLNAIRITCGELS
ncbi:MAG: hypothetical protein ACF8XB_09535 [Planctomycetota bacterium JB042]